jgi:hypothetical protein
VNDLTASVKPQLPTNQKFGWFFSSMFAVLAAYSYWKVWDKFAVTALVVALMFAALTLLHPKLLSPLNRLWYQLGMLLGKIVSPIVLGIIFFVLITPTSLVTRLFGRDELKLKKRSAESYWIDRSPPGPSSDSFNNQF